MSFTRKIMLSLAAIIGIFAVIVVVIMKKIYTPTEGAKIAAYSSPQKALLVIDVQQDYSGLKGKQPVLYPDVELQIAVINGLIGRASKAGVKVVYIRQIFGDNLISRLLGGRTIEGTPGAELDPRVRVVSGDDFTKKYSDAFSNPRLDEFLIANRVNELYLVGLDAAYCVYNTARGALNRGYKVTIVRNAIMTRRDLNEVLERYKKEGITTIPGTEITRM